MLHSFYRALAGKKQDLTPFFPGFVPRGQTVKLPAHPAGLW